MKMKKLLAFLMAIMIAVFVAACDSTQETAEEPEVSPAVSKTVEETEAAEEPVKPEDIFEYTGEGNYAVITKYVGDDNKVIIPNKIDGKTVVRIGSEAFANSFISEVVLPEELFRIDERAFYNCTNLKELICPKNLLNIDSEAFANCTALASISIPAELIMIEMDAFEGCNNISEIILNGNDHYSLENGILYSGGSTVICRIADKNIMADAYDKSCEELYEYSIVDDYAVIDKYLGHEDDVTLPKVLGGKQVREIGQNSFTGSTVKNVIIQEGVEDIEYEAFSECLLLKSVELPGTLTHISSGAFKECRSLKKITIPKHVGQIGDGAFKNCVSLEYVYIPESVFSIWDGAFGGNDNLRTIEVSESNRHYFIEDGILYSVKDPYGKGEKEADEVVVELAEENEGYLAYLQLNYNSDMEFLSWSEQHYDFEGRLLSDEELLSGSYEVIVDKEYLSRSGYAYIGENGTLCTYDANGNLITEYDYEYYINDGLMPGNQLYSESREYKYDSEGRLIASDYYEIEYHPNGQTKQVKYELGDLIAQNEYTSDGSLVCTKLINSEGRQVYRDEYTYDAAGNATICVGYSADGTARTQWERTFDENGNETSVKVYTWAGETAFRRVSTYDANGNLAGYKEYCGDGSLSFYKENTYDENDNILTSVSYSGDGQIMGSSEWTYDADGRETFMAEYDGEGQALYSRESEYDAAGNRVEFTENDPKGTYEYYHEVVTYDDAGKAKEKTITRDDKTVFVIGDFGEEQEVYVDEYEKFRDDAEIPLVPIKDIVDGYGDGVYTILKYGTKRIYAYGAQRKQLWYEEHSYNDEYVGIPYSTIQSKYDEAGNSLSIVYTYDVDTDHEIVYSKEWIYDDEGNVLSVHKVGEFE